jgi:hypothetical protein
MTTTIIDTYIDSWNETDADARAALIDKAWVADGARYRDPLLEADGLAGLNDMIATVQTHYPDHVMSRTSGVEVHHDLARFGWALTAPDGNVFVAGFDVAQLADDGRIVSIAGFMGDLPPVEG